jgi:8-oxo-dGTP pyrophosphatase MutT (NUDIX family)
LTWHFPGPCTIASSRSVADSCGTAAAGMAEAVELRMGIAAHIARLRAVVGHELLLLPSVSVLPVDGAGRVLLVREAGHDDGWGVLGGAVDVGESPAAAAVREAREEIGVDVELVRLLDVLGGPDYEVSYPNGDRVAYVTAVYVDGLPRITQAKVTFKHLS